MANRKPILSDSDLIKEFIACAIEREKAILGGTIRECTRIAYRMKALDEIFRERGREVQSMLLPYLDDPNEGVRYWASMRLWPIAPAKARATMENLPNYGFGVGAEAKGTLDRIDSGQFNPDYLWAPNTEKRE
jgi:hypothetical protein